MNHRNLLSASLVAILPWLANSSHAVGFGVFDARTQGLAGTGVAMGDLASGHFYNPALIALHEGDEDDTRDGRHSFPGLTARYSKATETAFNAVHDDLEGQLSSAIDNFNAAPGAAAALAGESAAHSLRKAMTDVQNKDIFADMYLGYALTEPGHKEGGAFFLGSRIVANGIANIRDEDITLIDHYIEALQFIHTGGVQGQAHPELFLASGRLADPNDAILSSALARVGVISEIGVSAARLFKLNGQVFSFGFSPKAVNLHLFDDEWEVVDGDFESEGIDQNLWFFNLDLGMIWAPTERFRVGVTSKDVFSKEVTSELGYTFVLKPRTRMGFAYDFDKVRIGMDMDLAANRTFANDFKTQDVTVGVEYTPYPFMHLRTGYYYDVEGTFDGKATFGLGFEWARMSVDVSYASGATDSTFGIQFGLSH